MKKMILMAAMLVSMAAMAQEPVITFSKTTHDFGKINEADGRVTTIFEFTNEGMVPLVLTNVKASCGCTTPKWTHEPIEPGAKGNITVTYNPNGRPGRFQKTITVTSNATEATTKLYIKGEVIPKPVSTTDQYPVQMGELRLKKKSLNFGLVKKGANKQLEIEYANSTDQPITIEFLPREQDKHYAIQLTLKTLQPGQTGKLQVALQSAECPLYGPIDTKVYLIVNGKRVLSDQYAITLKADLREDFSQMTVEERQQAPIIETSATIDLGVIKKGKLSTHKLHVANVGVNPLLIRRIISDEEYVNITAPKSPIKGGKSVDLKLDINATQITDAAEYSRVITLITNDPAHSALRIRINWTIE